MRKSRSLLYLVQLVLSSLSGFLLVRVVSYLWGTSQTAAAFEIAWSIPMFLVTASGLNVLQAVTANYFAEFFSGNDPQTSDQISSFVNIFLIIIGGLVLATFILSDAIAAYAAPGLDDEGRALVALLIKILSPVSATIGVGLFFGGVYTAAGKPVAAEFVLMGTRIGACFVVVLMIAFGYEVSAENLSWTLLSTSVLALCVVLLLARINLSYQYRATTKFSRKIMKAVGFQSLLFLLATAVGQFVLIVFRARIGEFDVSFVSAFAYSMLLTYTTSNILGKLAFFSTARSLQEAFATHEFVAYFRALFRVGFAAFAASTVAAITIGVFANTIVYLLFFGGQFDERSLEAVVRVTRILVWSIPATTLIWTLKLPAIMGRRKLLLPTTEWLVWLVLLVLVLIFESSLSLDALVGGLVFSYWVRVLIAIVIIWSQVKTEQRLIVASKSE